MAARRRAEETIITRLMGMFILKLKALLSTARIVILIRNRKAVLMRGRIPASTLAAFSDIARAYRIDGAMITVRGSGGPSVLSFSRGVPDNARQRFRNIWFSYPERKTTGI